MNRNLKLLEILLECGSPDKAILMIGSIENIEYRVAASQLAATAAKGIKKIESQADAWRLIADRFGSA